MKTAALIIAALAATACTHTAEIIAALAKDPATVCLTAVQLHGSITLARTAAPNANVRCSTDGLTVTTPDQP